MVFIAGSQDVVEPAWNNMPDNTPAHATRLMDDHAGLSAVALQAHLAPEIDRWKRTQKTVMVTEILEDRN